MHLHRTISELASKRDDLSDDKLRNTPGVAKGRIEDCDPVLCRILQVYLVGTNAETAYHDEVLGFFQYSSTELSLGADANDMDVSCYTFQLKKSLETRHRIPDLFDQLLFGKRRLEEFHLITLSRQDVTTGLVHVLEQ